MGLKLTRIKEQLSLSGPQFPLLKRGGHLVIGQEYVIDKVMNFCLLKAMNRALQGPFQLSGSSRIQKSRQK